jgi:hypothetical protein
MEMDVRSEGRLPPRRGYTAGQKPGRCIGFSKLLFSPLPTAEETNMVSQPYDISDITSLMAMRAIVYVLGTVMAHGKLGSHQHIIHGWGA